MKISNFRFFVGKCFIFFSISNFENGFSSWKFNIFYPDFFSWQGMIILHRKTTPALSLFDLSQERHGQTSTNPWNSPSSYVFSREASCMLVACFCQLMGKHTGMFYHSWTRQMKLFITTNENHLRLATLIIVLPVKRQILRFEVEEVSNAGRDSATGSPCATLLL